MRSIAILSLALPLLGNAVLAKQVDHLGDQDVFLIAIYNETEDPPADEAQVLVALENMMADAAAWNAENSYDVELGTSATTWNGSTQATRVCGFYPVPEQDPYAPYADLAPAVGAALADGHPIGEGDHVIVVRPGTVELQQAAGLRASGHGFSVYHCWIYGNIWDEIDPETSGEVTVIDYPDIDHAIKHESAHNYGANHARMESSYSGDIRAYGNLNDTMGGEASLARHVQAATKEWLGWMEPALTVTLSNKYVIAPLEIPRGNIPGADAHALRIATAERYEQGFNSAGEYYYYIENRSRASSILVDGQPVSLEFDTSLGYNAADGALINRVIVSDAGKSPHGIGIDATPETTFHDSTDCALMEGRSFFDPQAGVCVTNLGKEGENLRVEVNFVADFPDNRPPVFTEADVQFVSDPLDNRIVTFTASGTDPDEDELSYFWTFMVDFHKTGQAYQEVSWTGERGYGAGSNPTFSFPSTSPRRVFVKASDRKGGESDWVEVSLWNGGPAVHPVSPGGSIQSVIDDTGTKDGDVIELADGVYSGQGNVNLRFTGLKRLTIRAAPGASPVIQLAPGERGFVFDSSESQHCVVDGLTIRGGRMLTPGGYSDRGGAILLRKTSRPVIRNCVFEDNHAREGGAIYRDRVGQARIENCVFRGNVATAKGGAIYARVDTDAIPFQDDDGGAEGRMTIRNCRFEQNVAMEEGSALWIDDLAAAHRRRERSGLAFTGNEVVANFTSAGYALHFEELRGDPLFSGNTIARNLGGGGMMIRTLRGTATSTPTAILNTILWDNATADLSFDSSHAWVQNDRLSLRHCLTTEPWNGPASNTGNLSDAPRFTAPDAPTYDFSLSRLQSPCVDSGEWVPRDAYEGLGIERYDDPSVANTGSFPFGTGIPVDYVDIGAHERQSPSLAYWTTTPSVVWNARQSIQGSSDFYHCEGQSIFVGADFGTVEIRNRAFFDFDTPGTLSSGIDTVWFDIDVFDGMDPWYQAVETRSMPQSTVDLAELCGQLWDSISTSTTYSVDVGFYEDFSTVRVDLGPQAAADLEAQTGVGGGWFSVGLRSANESVQNMMQIRNAGHHRLHVFYESGVGTN